MKDAQIVARNESAVFKVSPEINKFAAIDAVSAWCYNVAKAQRRVSVLCFFAFFNYSFRLYFSDCSFVSELMRFIDCQGTAWLSPSGDDKKGDGRVEHK